MKCAMRNVKCAMRKSGVSLITVLLFMLVATIAATATYKWITSEGRSSANRMLEREAYQSAVAGIESAVSWMTYHANDVGALIRQYKVNGNKAVELDNQLAELVRAGQSFRVWLTGVSTENNTYKLKLVSEGVSRNGAAKHSEIAILNVDGLYRVRIPTTTRHITFDKAFQGAVSSLTNSPTLQSAIVNGSFSGNQPTVTEQLIVTGDVTLAGPKDGGSGLAGADLYVGGNLTVSGNSIIGSGNNVAYVGGNVSSCAGGKLSVYGDLHVAGNYAANCAVDVNGNFTVGGTFNRGTADYGFKVTKNFVFKDNAIFNWVGTVNHSHLYDNGTPNPNKAGVGKNTYLAKVLAEKNSSGARKINLGSKVYVYNGFQASFCQNACTGFYDAWGTWQEKGSSYQGDLNCGKPKRCPSGFCEGFFLTSSCHMANGANVGVGDNRYFSFYSPEDAGRVQSSKIGTWSKKDGVLKDVSDNYWNNIADMEAYGRLINDQHKVPQAIILKDTLDWLKKTTGELKKTANKRCKELNLGDHLVSGDNYYISDMQNMAGTYNVIHELNQCYAYLSLHDDDILYNGFMIVEFAGGVTSNMAQGYAQDGQGNTEALNGKFVFYFNSQISGTFYLPVTTENSAILFYAPSGGGTLTSADKDHKDDLDGEGKRTHYYNYFVLSAGVKKSMTFDKVTVTGTAIMADESQASIADGNVNLQYKGSVIDALERAGLIEENPDYTALANPSAGASGASIAGGGAPDDYYIATAPQLSITIETQYANVERIDNIAENGQEAEGTFIVLPRIIYLSGSPEGRLSDYYNVLPLNSRLSVQNKSVDCGGAIPVTGKLVPTANHKLTSGNYTCTVSGTLGGRESTVPFYVVVSGGNTGTAAVTFAKGQEELKKTDPPANVQLRIPTSDPAQNYTVKVTFPTYNTSEWEVTPVGANDGCTAGSTCTFVISSTTELHTIFTVQNKNASSGQLDFQIIEATGCDIGSPYIESIMVSNNINVRRLSLAEWCNANGDGSTDEDKAFCLKKSNPDCNVTAGWVQAVGSQCQVHSTNETWGCKNTADIYLQPVYSNIPTGCEILIPGANLADHTTFGDADEVTLYASLKSQPFTFTTGFVTEKADDQTAIASTQTIHISVERWSTSENQYNEVNSSDCTYENFKDPVEGPEKCSVPVYYGDRVTLSFPNDGDDDHFNYWMCESGPDCPTPKVPSHTDTYTRSVTGSDQVIAHFEETDKHCFFDEFKNTAYSNRTAVLCGAGNTETLYCIDGDGKHPNAKWVLQSGASGNIEFNGDGRISLSAQATRTQKESEKPSVTIMSRAQAGVYGTLKAQFQVPREGVNARDIAKSTIKQSGFILRSNTEVTNYLMLNIYSDKDNNLWARLCPNGGETCQSKKVGSAEVHPGDVILAALTLEKAEEGTANAGKDILKVRAYTQAFSSTYSEVEFVIDDANQTNEYVGFRLSDQNFKVYGIGWKSDDYFAQCWDTFPIITCSFKAAYPGGIVPKDKTGFINGVKPWVGFSRWFSNFNNQCEPEYYYSGNDAGCSGSVANTSYKSCPSTGYHFGDGSDGVHGVGDEKAARVGVNSYCGTVYGESSAWATSEVTAHCGKFWVGDITPCREHHNFTASITGSEGSYFALDNAGTGLGNLRDADLVVTMETTSELEVSVYLFSRTSGYYYSGEDAVYSRPYTTKVSATNPTITVNVNDIADADGFDPERVAGVYVKYTATTGTSVTSVHSSCPNALGLKSCKAEYIKSSNEWKVTAVVNNTAEAGALDVTKVTTSVGDDNTTTTSTNLMGNSKNCTTTPSECAFTNDTDQEWTITLDHSPYYSMGTENSISYQFTVALYDRGNPAGHADKSPCVTPVEKVTRITRSCSISDSKKSVRQGTGIPALTYSITGCPASNNACKYKVVLMKGNDVVGDPVLAETSANGTITNNTTDPDAANKTTQLEVGTDYKLVLQSTSTEYPFNDCSQTFEVKEAGAQSDTYQADCWWERNNTKVTKALAGFTGMNFKVKTTKGFSQNTTGKLVFGGRETDVDLYSTGNTSSISNYNQNNGGMPAANPSNEYSVVYDGEVVCTGTIATEDPLTCGLENSDVQFNASNNFVVSWNSLVSSCWSCTCSGTSSCPGNGSGSAAFTVTSSNNPLSLSISCTCDNISTSCSAVAEAEVVAPTLDCDDVPNKINAEPGANVTITPISVGNCAGGCTYWVNNKVTGDKVTPETNRNITTQTSVSFTGESKSGENTYTLSVNNAKGTATCDVLVDYKTPSYSCPDAITAEPGAQVTVTPTNVSYCSGGCDYKITGTGIDDIEGENFTSGSLADKIVDTNNPITGTAVTGGVAKKYSLTLSNGAGAGTACDVTVNYMKPTFTCPGNQEVAVNADVTVTPTNVSYCTKGCSYTISGGSFDNVTGTTGNNYTGGDLTNTITGEATSTASGDGTEYTLTLHNPAGDNATACKFKVKYLDDTPVCASVTPENVDCTDGNSGNVQNWGTGAKCVKIKTSGTYLQSSNGSGRYFCVNGVAATMNENEMAQQHYSPDADGYVTVCATAGDFGYTQIAWYNCDAPSSGEESSTSSGGGGDYCSVTPTFVHDDCSQNSYGTNGFNTTGAVCLKINGNVGGFGCSECAGRQWRINGGNWTTSTGSITATSDGYSYIDVSSGDKSWASIAVYNISCP